MMAPQDTPYARFLDVLSPMHAVLDHTGHIVHAGPTLAKLSSGKPVKGMRFLELLEVMRPYLGPGMQELLGAAGTRLHLRLRNSLRTELKAVLMPLPEGMEPAGGAVVNLSFGISLPDAVRDFNLNSADFAVTDQAIEMLYLVEAKTAAMEASRKLNTRLEGARVAAQEQAFTDTLTGLKNRRAFDPVTNRLLKSGREFALVQLDLDYFKAVNDTMGHAAGDFVLQNVAERILLETREKDTIMRVGGDEFVLVLPDVKSQKTLTELCERLITTIERPYEFEGRDCHISASIGATLTTKYEDATTKEMMDDADVALYAAKDAGRRTHRIYHKSLRDPAVVEADQTWEMPLLPS